MKRFIVIIAPTKSTAINDAATGQDIQSKLEIAITSDSFLSLLN
jgi:hypothetical protein